MRKRIMASLLAVIMLTGILPMGTGAANYSKGTTYVQPETAASSANTGSSSSVPIADAPEYYGRSAIAKLSNADNLLHVYDELVKGIENSDAEIILYDGTHAVTADEVAIAMDAYRRDHVEHFWLGLGYSYSILGDGSIYAVSPVYSMSGDALTTAKAAFNSAVDEMLEGITSSMSEYEREKLIHDRLAAKVTYGGTDPDNIYTAYGALVEETAVCEGYAEAFQYLLYKAGIQSFLMLGSGDDPSTEQSSDHEWNVVRIDGKYYQVDVTWDDQGEELYYAYFNKTDTDFAEDHTTQTAEYALPVCNSTDAEYFTINGGKMASFDATAVAEAVQKGDGVGHVYVTGDLTAFVESLKSNIGTVLTKLGYSCSSWKYKNLGRELVITILPTSVKLNGSVVCCGSASDAVTIELFSGDSTDAAYKLTVAGTADAMGDITATYGFDAVTPGSYTMKISKKNHVSREYSITLGASGLVQNAKINLLGDANGDGKISDADALRIADHIKKISLLTGYALECADANGDDKISVIDMTMVESHARKTSKLW